jgi:hypothetical protein
MLSLFGSLIGIHVISLVQLLLGHNIELGLFGLGLEFVQGNHLGLAL